MKSGMRQSQSGFTLVELAIVLVILGILMASFISSLTTRIETSRHDQAVKELEQIKSALLGYAYSQAAPALPCPDCIKTVASGDCPGVSAAERDGISDYNVNACSVATGDVGTLPWIGLGLGSSDPWGTRYRYWVDPEYADKGGFTLGSGMGIGRIQAPNFLIVTVPPGAASKLLANNVVAVVFSHGRNTLGGISSTNVARPAIPVANIDEANNDDDNVNTTFISRILTSSDSTIAGGEFDDIVVWITEAELKASMLKAHKLP